MTREAFIKKWLGNRDYNYCEEHKELMRDDLDSILEFHQQQVKSVDLADVGESFNEYTTQVGMNRCTSCGSMYCDGNICT